MKRNAVLAVSIPILGHELASLIVAQEILPFPPAPSASIAGLTMEDSVYKKRVEPKDLRRTGLRTS